jgi:hypothetical protein
MISRNQDKFAPPVPRNLDRLAAGLMLELAEIPLELY